MAPLKSIEQVLRELEPTVDPNDLDWIPTSPLDHADYWNRNRPREGLVYFIQGDPKMPVKIGTALNVSKRLSGLQTGNHMKLTVLQVGRGRACLCGDSGLRPGSDHSLPPGP